MTMSDSDDDDNSDIQKIRITLHCAAANNNNMSVPTAPIAIPADTGRKGLSAVVQHLLQLHRNSNENDNDNTNMLFDFIVGRNPTITTSSSSNHTNNRLLRTSLEREVRRCHLSTEDAIPVTYFLAQPVPQEDDDDDTDRLDDWVGVLDYYTFCNNSATTSTSMHTLLAGCYDGSVVCYHHDPSINSNNSNHQTSALRVTTRATVHSGPIKSLAVMTNTRNNDNNNTQPQLVVATGSMDQRLRLHTYNYYDKEQQQQLATVAECIDGHASSVTSLSFAPNTTTCTSNNTLLASGDWKGGLCLWNVGELDLEGTCSNSDRTRTTLQKKPKTDNSPAATTNSKAATATTTKLTPVTTLRAHVGSISGLSWIEKDTSLLLTGSWDHSLKLWDVTQQDCILTLHTGKVVTCLAAASTPTGIVVTGHADHAIRLWDTRTNNSHHTTNNNNDTSFRHAHTAFISAIQWTSPHHITSTSHDGTMKLWDIRSPLPLHTVRAVDPGEKALCCAIGNGERFVGGSDGRVHRWSGL